VQAQLETKQLTALAQQNSTLPSPRQQKTAEDRQPPGKLRKPVMKQKN
jgi:hypothetical protein